MSQISACFLGTKMKDQYDWRKKLKEILRDKQQSSNGREMREPRKSWTIIKNSLSDSEQKKFILVF